MQWSCDFHVCICPLPAESVPIYFQTAMAFTHGSLLSSSQRPSLRRIALSLSVFFKPPPFCLFLFLRKTYKQILGPMEAQWVVPLPYGSSVSGLILSLIYCLCGISLVLFMSIWSSYRLFDFLGALPIFAWTRLLVYSFLRSSAPAQPWPRQR